jgi:hypothetical protein
VPTHNDKGFDDSYVKDALGEPPKKSKVVIKSTMKPGTLKNLRVNLI